MSKNISRLYYTPPTKEQFDELKQKAIDIWQTYDNEYGYVDEKVKKIKDRENIGDNFMYIVAMFDSVNQSRLACLLSEETQKAVADRIKDGGTPDSRNQFL